MANGESIKYVHSSHLAKRKTIPSGTSENYVIKTVFVILTD